MNPLDHLPNGNEITNLCRDLSKAKVGDIVAFRDRGNPVELRLVKRVTPNYVIIQNGGGVGTEAVFDHSGRERGSLRSGVINSVDPDKYNSIVVEQLKRSVIARIMTTTLSSLTLDQLLQAGRHLGIDLDSIKPNRIY